MASAWLPWNWWLFRQRAAVRWYVITVIGVAAGLTVPVVAEAGHSPFALGGVLSFVALAVLVSLGTRPILAAFPGSPSFDDPVGAWMLAALLLWGPREALVIAVVVAGVWVQVFDRRWGVSERETAKQVFNVATLVIGIDTADLVIRLCGPQPHMLGEFAGLLAYLLGSIALVFGVMVVAGVPDSLAAFTSWSQRVVLLTEVPLAVGLAVTWRAEPLAGALLSLVLVAAGAGQHAAHLLEEASTDRRTGLLRPDAWVAAASRELGRRPLGVVVADLDYFKKINDQHGHLVGDAVLNTVSSAIVRAQRSVDIAGRWGGEEFVVAVPSVTPSELRTIAERIAQSVRASPHTDADTGQVIRCTVSVGFAYADPEPRSSAETVRDILRCADQAMYGAKAAGRDTVVGYDDLADLASGKLTSDRPPTDLHDLNRST